MNQDIAFLSELADVVKQRRINPDEKSYTSHLFNKGINKIAQKVGEESVELIIEAKDRNIDLFKEETADMLFHLLVLIEEMDTSLEEVVAVLKKRHSS